MRRRRARYVLILLLLLVAGGLVVRAWLRGPTIKTGSYLLLDIGGAYEEAPPQDLAGRLLHRHERTLIDLLTMVREAQVDRRIAGIIARIRSLEAGWGKVQDARDALVAFKRSGKPLLALLEGEARGSNKEYYLATAADRIYLAPDVTAPLNGLAAQFVFLGGVWDKLDIEMSVEKIREYKTLGDMIANKEMTPAHREMANSLLDSIEEQFVAGIAQGRGLEAAAVRALIDECPVAPAEFESAQLSNGTRYLQDLQDELGGAETPLVEMTDYAQVSPASLGLGTGPKIAVVYAVGTIVTGESGTGVEGQMLGADTATEALKEAAEDDDVRAIVLRIDSPGGSALASDLVWRATQQARRKKPLIVSMSDVAASGGYYIAAGASRILAQPGTLTGSIGVVFVRPNVHGFLARIGVNTETIGRGRFAELDDLTTPLSDAGRQKLIDEMQHIYDIFVQRVAAGRNMTAERVNDVGRGRVWTGAQATENGLVDEAGGFMAAIQAAKRAAGVEPEKEVQLVFFPRPRGALERVGELLGARASLDVPRPWQDVLRSVVLPFADGTLLALMPEMVDVR
jgi:protease-4